MPISFTAPGGGDPARVFLRIKDLAQHINREDRIYVAERQKARIIARTTRGTDFEGRAFKEYSAAYAKKKAKSGRSGTRVDLTWSGQMLQQLVTRADAGTNDFRIGIYGEAGVRAAAHNSGEGHMPERRFVDASASDISQMTQDLEARINARLRQTLLNAA